MSFALALPWEHRAWGAPLYKRIVAAAFPDLYRFPLQGNYGLGSQASRLSKGVRQLKHRARRLLSRMAPRFVRATDPADLQRFDIATALRSETAYASLVRSLVAAVEARAVVPHVDIAALLHDHREHRRDGSRALRLLASLELSMRAAEAGVPDTGA